MDQKCETAVQTAPEIGTWIGKSGAITLDVPPGCTELTLTVHSGPGELYDFFPFLVTFAVDGETAAIVEFDDGWDWRTVRLPVRPGQASVVVEVWSELATRPVDRNLGQDERVLSVCVREHSATAGNRLPQRNRLPSHGPGSWKEALNRPAPVFVIGCYRSGTSILTWAIGQHPHVFPLDETNWLPTLCLAGMAAFALAARKGQQSGPAIYDLEQDDFLRWQGASVDRLHMDMSEERAKRISLGRLAGKERRFDPRFRLDRSPAASKWRWVDGTPENTSVAIGLAHMFPRARFIYLVREPRAVVRSLMRFHEVEGPAFSFEEAVLAWESLNMAGYEAAKELGPTVVLPVRYADLANDPDRTLDRIFAFVDAPAFPKAAESFGQMINSSPDQPVAWTGAQVAELERLDRIDVTP